MSAYFVRYAQQKRGFEELYEVVERASNAAVDGPLTHDEAKLRAELMNAGQSFAPLKGRHEPAAP